MSRVVLALVLLSLPVFAQSPRPLPDQDAFLRGVRTHLDMDEQRQQGYSYVETRRQAKLNKKGDPVGETVKVVESYPGFPGQPRWERLISEDGKPLSPADLEKQDRKRREAADAFLRAQQKQTADDRAKVERERAKSRREREEMVDDAFRVFDVRMLGREVIDGHETIGFSFDARPHVPTHTRLGGLLRHFHGRVWFNEPDYEMVKLNVEAVDDVSIGLGLLARLHKGAAMYFERKQLDDKTWLPLKATYTASARILLVRSMRVGGTTEYSNYRKFTVETSETYGADRH